MKKESIFQEGIKIFNVYVPNKNIKKHEAKLIKLQG